MAFTPVAIKDGSGTSVNMSTYQDGASYNIPVSSNDLSTPHYSAAKNQLTPVASSTAVFVFTGSATKTVRVKRIRLSGIATAAGEQPFSIKKNSSAGTLGSAALTTITAVPHDSSDAAATAVFSTVGTAVYTTLPTLVGVVATGELGLAATTTGNAVPVYEWSWGKGGKALVLRGVAECLTVDFLGTSVVSGGKFSCEIEWSEDAS